MEYAGKGGAISRASVDDVVPAVWMVVHALEEGHDMQVFESG